MKTETERGLRPRNVPISIGLRQVGGYALAPTRPNGLSSPHPYDQVQKGQSIAAYAWTHPENDDRRQLAALPM
jgi:hypothetical protein